MQLFKVVPTALAIFMLSSILSATEAREKILCDVTNDIDKETARIVYEIDEESRELKGLFTERYVNNKLVERSALDISDLLGAGVVLHKKDKYVTVRLYSHNFDEVRGGILYLDTLYNAINGQRKEYVIETSISDAEATMSYNGVAFKKMHFVAKRSGILGPIGVERIEFKK